MSLKLFQTKHFLLSGVILLLVLFIPEAVMGGAWVKKKGKGYSQYSFTYLKYSKLINKDGSLSDLKRTVKDFTVQSYFEYGITDKISIVAVFPYKYMSTGKEILSAANDPYPQDTLPSGSLKGFSNILSGLKYNIYEGNYILSGQFVIQFPSWKNNLNAGLRSGYDSWGFTPSILFGKGFNKTYFSGLLGVQLKSNGYSHYGLANIEFGYLINWKKLKTWLITVIDAYIPLIEGKHDDGLSVHTGTYRNREGHVSPGLKINQSVSSRFWINFAAYGAFWANHGGRAPTLNIGLAYEF